MSTMDLTMGIVEDEEITISYRFDYVKGLLFIYENHKFEGGNECRLYKGDVEINRLTQEQIRTIWDSGKASEFIYDNNNLFYVKK